MKTLYSYEVAIEVLKQKKGKLKRDLFWALAFEFDALYSARTREIAEIDELIQIAEEAICLDK